MADLSSTTIAAFLNDLDKRNALQVCSTSPLVLLFSVVLIRIVWLDGGPALI